MITRIAVEILYPKAKKVVFQTNRVKQYFRKKICENSIIIFNPISVSILAKKVKEKKIVSAGRLSKQKNQELLIEAFSKISCRYPAYSLWIYGEGELRQQLVKQADSLGIRDKIHFPGNVPDIHEKISDAELFVLSSDYEGLSNAKEITQSGFHSFTKPLIFLSHTGIFFTLDDPSTVRSAT